MARRRVVNLAAALVQSGHRTLLVDADAQANAIHLVEDLAAVEAGLLDVITCAVAVDKVLPAVGLPPPGTVADQDHGVGPRVDFDLFP